MQSLGWAQAEGFWCGTETGRASLGAEDCSDKFGYLHSFKKTIFTIKRYMKFKRCTGQETKGLGQIFHRAEWDFLQAPVVK